jgi:ADP-ribose pyrophosphatase
MIHSLYKGKFLELVAEGTWEFVRRSGDAPAVGIVAVTEEGKMILISQFRLPVGRICVEIPAGLVGDSAAGESWKVAAIRELREETGYAASDMEFLTEGPTSAGLTSERVILCRAIGVTHAGAAAPDGDEKITVHEVPLEEVPAFLEARVKDGWMIDTKVYAGLYFLRMAAKAK